MSNLPLSTHVITLDLLFKVLIEKKTIDVREKNPMRKLCLFTLSCHKTIEKLRLSKQTIVGVKEIIIS